MVLRFGTKGARNESGQHELLVITAKLDGDSVVCSCSLEERCLSSKGCSSGSSIQAALEQVRSAMDVSLSNLFVVLGAAVKTRNLRDGQGVLYGEKTCVVRDGETSLPFSAV